MSQGEPPFTILKSDSTLNIKKFSPIENHCARVPRTGTILSFRKVPWRQNGENRWYSFSSI